MAVPKPHEKSKKMYILDSRDDWKVQKSALRAPVRRFVKKLAPKRLKICYNNQFTDSLAEVSKIHVSDIKTSLEPWYRTLNLHNSESVEPANFITSDTEPKEKSNSNLNSPLMNEEEASETVLVVEEGGLSEVDGPSLLDLLEAEFYELTNPILDGAHALLMEYSPESYNARGADMFLQKTLDWALSRFSGPSSLSELETSVRALLNLKPELDASSGIQLLEKPWKNLSKLGCKKNAVLRTAHAFLENTAPYFPNVINYIFKDTLKYVLSRYSGPSKLCLEKVLEKTLLHLESELDQFSGPKLIPLPGIEEIRKNLPRSDPVAVTAQMMFYILSDDLNLSDDRSYYMILKSLKWALLNYADPHISDPLTKTMVALINAEPHLEHAFETSLLTHENNPNYNLK